MHVMIFGAGFSGLAIARELEPEADRVSGTTRSLEKFPILAASGAEPLLYAGGPFSVEIRERLQTVTHIVASISPDNGGDPLLEALAEGLPALVPSIQWVGYLSTVGVYGDHQGEWVNENTPCRPVSRRSIARVAAEEAWATLGERDGVPVARLRLSGIYGPGRNTFVSLANGTARRLVKPDQVFNRIHVEDIAGATAFLARRLLGGIVNVTDDLPAPPQDVVSHAAGLMGIEPPPESDFESADLSPMARSFYGENKRVSNDKIKTLGYRFQFPDYKAGLSALIRDQHWRG